MKLIPFGLTNLEVSDLCLDAMNFGWNTDKCTSFAILDTFCRNGGNFIQAASSVNKMNTAVSELHVGNWIAGRNVERNELVLATELTVRHEDATGNSLTQAVRLCCETSLRRLRVDYLDLLWCELRTNHLPMQALLEALSNLVDEGLVHHIGAFNSSARQFDEANASSARHSLPLFAALQNEYSLARRDPFETELAHACHETGAAFLARSPFAGSFLTDAARRQRSSVSTGRRMWPGVGMPHQRSPEWRDAIELIAASRGATIAQTALAWVLAQPQVTSAVVGVTSPADLRHLIEGTSNPMSEQDLVLFEDPLSLAFVDRRPAHTVPLNGRREELVEAQA